MRSSIILAGIAATVPALAQRPANESICSYYTTALLKNDTAANELTLLTLLVNTVVIGNYTKPNVGVSVPGILAKGTYNGTEVDLLPYFNGGLNSTNDNGTTGVAVNFLDDGGAEPLMMNKPANTEDSNQYRLMSHLYQYFGVLIGCNSTGFPAYAGQASQASVHKFMDLNIAQVGYFIQNVALAAASFGVAEDDIAIVGKALGSIFNVRCAAPTTVIPEQGAQLQSICMAPDCAIAPNATCAAYPTVMEPAVFNVTLAGVTNASALTNFTSSSNSSSASGSASGTSTAATSTHSGSAATAGAAIGAGLLAMFAYVL